MKTFNLTEWALEHKEIVYFFVFLVFVSGVFSYQRLGRMEDPDFVIRQMVISVGWPGASARQVEEQVTDKIEKKLQDTPGLDYLKSYSTPGQAVIYVNLKESINEKDVRPTWLEVRNMVKDIQGTLPQGVAGPYYNDRFDDVFGNVYALTAADFSYEEMRAKAEQIRRILLGVTNVKKVELTGVQPEKIFIEMESTKLSQLGIDPNLIINSVKAQSSMAASGMVETSSDDVYLRVSGLFEDVDELANLPIRTNSRTFRLGDVAKIKRSYIEPMDPKMFFNGQPAIGIAVSMDKGGNILTMGADLDKTLVKIKKDLMLGMEIHQVSNQPKVVKESIGEFIKSLAEAIVIVLAVSFLSLGFQSGIVVALCIPLVIAGIFACMEMAAIDLHKVSLGALIIALGLLVDDAIIAIEMMTVKLEQGWSRFDAACYAYTSTAFPMLTGTLITAAGFIPIGFSKGDAAEFTSSLFPVITMALLISWVVSVTVTPLLGYKLIKPKHAGESGHDLYETRFYHIFRRILTFCLIHKKMVLAITVASFIGSLFLLKLVKQEFFPPSVRPELIVELNLPSGASLTATEQEAQKLADSLAGDGDIESYSYYVGKGAPRFILTMEPKLPMTNYAQFIVVAKNLEAREVVHKKITALFAEKFPSVRGNIKYIQTGPPSNYPVMLRVNGYDHEQVRELAGQVRAVMAKNPSLTDINFDWDEKSKTMHLTIDQDKARMLGLSSQGLAQDLQTQLSGASIAEFYQQDKTVGIVFRIDPQNRNDLAKIKDLPVHIGNGKFVPLEQIAKISYDAEEGVIWRYNLEPTITVQANVVPGVTGTDATTKLYESLKAMRENLPAGYNIAVAGSAEKSQSSIGFLLKTVPAMIVVIVVLLMFQLQKVSLMILTLLTAPLGIIGVAISMLLTGRPMGFVAQLGILALSGMIIRNSVILIDQIEKHIDEGKTPWEAIINSAVLRFRPIMLTAMAAILGMLPLVPSTFWGPMAVAIGGGLLGATVMTLLVLPAMYAAWFKVTPETPGKPETP
ncbi:MAG TPA: efflux RND transporter permease subunit [Patescibacteria group bacterium]|nr:efflux RND transporter permease subunit [Patescibacteria group bacterium]